MVETLVPERARDLYRCSCHKQRIDRLAGRLLELGYDDHADLKTLSVYVQADVEMKRKALESAGTPIKARCHRRRDPDLLRLVPELAREPKEDGAQLVRDELGSKRSLTNH